MIGLDDVQRKILSAAADHDLTNAELKALYSGKFPGMRNAMLVRNGLMEWIRPDHNPSGGAIGIRITDAGRKVAQTF